MGTDSEQGKKATKNLAAIAARPDIWLLGFHTGVESVKAQMREASVRAAERIFYSFDEPIHGLDVPAVAKLIQKEIEASLSLQGGDQDERS